MTEATIPDCSQSAQAELAWQQLLAHVRNHSPFYREHLDQAGIAPTEYIPLTGIARIPTVDKGDTSCQTARFLCVPRKKVVDIVTTSGSTGKPLLWYLTESDLERLAENELLSFSCAGFTADDRVLLAVATDRCFIAGMAYYLGLRKLGCAVVRAGAATPALHLDMIRRAQPTAVVSVPSFLLHLADKAAAAGIDLATCGIRKAVCIGEAVREADFSLNHAGRLIEQRWGARVFSTYGVTELAASLCECEAGCGGHLHPENLFLESLDEGGRPVPDGEVGELAATTLGVEGMPLIRYRTGDFAAIHRAPCRCGRDSLRIGPIVGRKNQRLKLKGTSVFPSALKSILDDTPVISAYAIIARRDRHLADVVEVRIACAGDDARVVKDLRERFSGEIKVAPEITRGSITEIEQLQMPTGARKRRYFIDLRE